MSNDIVLFQYNARSEPTIPHFSHFCQKLTSNSNKPNAIVDYYDNYQSTEFHKINLQIGGFQLTNKQKEVYVHSACTHNARRERVDFFKTSEYE